VTEFRADIRVGGTYRLAMLSPDGEEFAAYGEYVLVDEPSRLQYTWTWEETPPDAELETLLTIEFHDLANGTTEIVLTHERLRNVESRDAHGDGWTQVLEKLDEFLTNA
jgi:glutathione S-transferase